MFIDSQITDIVLAQALERNLPVLGVHDSFIVDYDHADSLRDMMNAATAAVVGTTLPITQSSPSPRGFPGRHVQLDYIQWRQTPRCESYLRKLG